MTALTIASVCEFLERFAPPALAEEWDNVGLLVGDRSRPVHNIMTCLTVTPDSAGEAVLQKVDLLVTHHPLPFRALKRITTDEVPGRLLLQLIEAGVAVFSPHTAFDSAQAGINHRWAETLGLQDVRPLVPTGETDGPIGAGRWGRLPAPVPLGEMAERVKSILGISGLHMVGRPEQPICTVGVACGAAGEFLQPARQGGCDLFITGETHFHTCLEAEATGVALLLPGHFASERFAVEYLAEVIARQFPVPRVWASRAERDPLVWV